ncbi:hypothetical protein HMPREF9422_1094 [Streptococcus cristatus ATCC 51100]|nr:hypothetical protein HMPREF9422_1094 [Streptococcus cristatus ATCC 51100]
MLCTQEMIFKLISLLQIIAGNYQNLRSFQMKMQMVQPLKIISLKIINMGRGL